jgi:uncharacterized protein YqeY
MTKQDLQNELKSAMLAKNEGKKSTLRMLISAIGYYEIQKGGAGYEATDEDILAVIQKEAKQRKDAITQYNDGGRPELAAKEEKELKLLETYLPAQMGEEEIRILVKEAISTTGASSVQDMGKIMGALMPKVKGKADGSLVNKIVKEELAA